MENSNVPMYVYEAEVLHNKNERSVLSFISKDIATVAVMCEQDTGIDEVLNIHKRRKVHGLFL